MAINIISNSFENGEIIPRKFTCDGDDISPELSWEPIPVGTKSFALIADDPDAPVGTWTHWLLYDIPANFTALPENIAKTAKVPGIGKQGVNDFRKLGYGGPCPPVGKPHRYFFKLFALDTKLNLRAGASKQELEHALHGHILDQGVLIGLYGR